MSEIVEQIRAYRFSVCVVVRFRYMAGVIVIVGPMIPLVLMIMIVGSFAMRMRVIVLVGVVMGMIMNVFVAVFHVPVCMLVRVYMRMIVFMQMIVFVFSLHHQFSLISGWLQSFKCFSSRDVLSASQFFVNGLTGYEAPPQIIRVIEI
jgi:hypothetical protein